MEKLFDVSSYRSYLDNCFVYKNIKDNYPYRNRRIDKSCDGLLQKIIDDTKLFISNIVEVSKNNDYRIGEELIINWGLREKFYFFNSSYFDGWLSDELYCPDGFDSNFLVSKYLLEQFFKCFGIGIEDYADEYYSQFYTRQTIKPWSEIFIRGYVEMFEQIDYGILSSKEEKKLVKAISSR